MRSNPLVQRVILAAVLVGCSAWLALAQQEQPGKEPGKPPPAEAKAETAARPKCPVMGGPVDFSVKVQTADGPVYFCCEMCISKYEKEPQKYAEKVAAQRAALAKLERVQVSCPVTGKPVDGKTFAEVAGQKVAFCCPDCVAKYQKYPAGYKAKLEGGYSYQTLCPVSGEKIDPTAFKDLPTGQRIYFCCPACIDKLLKEPAKYAPKLEAQGVKIDPQKVQAASDKPQPDEHAGHK